MKKKNIQSENVERLSNRDYKKALRRAKRTKRATAKAKATEKKEAEEKIYTVFLLFDKRSKNAVMSALKDTKVKPYYYTDHWVYMKSTEDNHITKDVVDKIRKAMSKCTIKYNGKEYKVQMSTMRSKEQILKEKRAKKPTNNTLEVRAAARKRRKDTNVAKHLYKHEFATKRALKKKSHIVGRKAKVYTTDANGVIVRINYHRGTEYISMYNKRILERAKKAGQYLIKKELQNQKAIERSKNATSSSKKNSNKNPKVVQAEFNFAA